MRPPATRPRKHRCLDLIRSAHSCIIDVELRFKSRGKTMSSRAFLGIGELGRRTGLAPSALRFYERAGLLVPDGRANGRRYYSSASVERIALIRLCQDAGFTLAEVRAFL